MAGRSSGAAAAASAACFSAPAGSAGLSESSGAGAGSSATTGTFSHSDWFSSAATTGSGAGTGSVAGVEGALSAGSVSGAVARPAASGAVLAGSTLRLTRLGRAGLSVLAPFLRFQGLPVFAEESLAVSGAARAASQSGCAITVAYRRPPLKTLSSINSESASSSARVSVKPRSSDVMRSEASASSTRVAKVCLPQPSSRERRA